MQFAPMSDAPLIKAAPKRNSGWILVPIRRIEDLGDAVLGAGLEAVQLSRAPVTGSLAFAGGDGVVLS
jgi:hypothetical protein